MKSRSSAIDSSGIQLRVFQRALEARRPIRAKDRADFFDFVASLKLVSTKASPFKKLNSSEGSKKTKMVDFPEQLDQETVVRCVNLR